MARVKRQKTHTNGDREKRQRAAQHIHAHTHTRTHTHAHTRTHTRTHTHRSVHWGCTMRRRREEMPGLIWTAASAYPPSLSALNQWLRKFGAAFVFESVYATFPPSFGSSAPVAVWGSHRPCWGCV
jgi:ABC-type Zn2+ transport system substrate-binding protein/surface adhesin